ncbi:MAG TPA: PQQ-dependent sugar dehydrogenase, partial [Xanthomonadales bacterium]|nr:PQQ-dependent sugar dehydrogenase [Xanthomonadales bacterium]
MPTILPRSFVLPALLCAATATAQTAPPGISVTTALAGLNTPTAVRFARDGRVFVAEKMGRVLEFDNLLDTTPRVVIDLRTATHNYWDRGLLGLALDRDFPDQPYVYIAYTYDAGIGGTAPRWGVPNSNGDECEGPLAGGGATEPGGGCVVSGRVSRLALGGATTTERVLVEDWFQQYPSHSMGALQVDASGALYASGGDGASFAFVDFGQADNPNFPDTGSPPDEGGSLRAQDWRTSGDPMGLNGSIIRIVPSTGEPAPGNPGFADYTLSDNARRVLAYGLRNPFRHTLRPGANELWIGDVGMDRWEELDVLPLPQGAGAPANFGWPCFEGAEPQGGFDAAGLPLCESLYASPPAALRPPLFQYGHVSASCTSHGSALSGIAFQPGDALGSAYRNALFFADYARNRIFVLRDANGDGDPDVPAGGTCAVQNDPDALVFVDGTANGSVLAVDLVAGPGGDLYYVDVGNGSLQRVHASGDRAPAAALVLEGGSTVGGPPRTVMLSAANSVDPDAGDTLTYDWDLDGDGAFDDKSGTGLVEAIADLATNGTHRLGVRVTDAAGRSDEQRIRLFVGNTPPVPVIAHPTASAPLWRTGDSIALLGGGTDEEDGPLPGTALQWTVTLAHCTDETFVDCHDHPVTTINGTRGTVTTPSHSYP